MQEVIQAETVAEKVVEVQEKSQVETVTKTISKQKFEVVIVGTMRFMPADEIADNAKAVSARRLFKRVDGERQPTTAVVLTYEEEPPAHVYIFEERFTTRDYVRPTTRCFHCQGWNHRQQGCKRQAKCAQCGGQHKTSQCKKGPEVKPKCANCKGDHSAASPLCPKYLQVR